MAKKIPVVQIDKGVPLPQERKSITDKVPFTKLEVGESIEFDGELRTSTASRASSWGKKEGKRFTIRHIDGNKYRIWRIK